MAWKKIARELEVTAEYSRDMAGKIADSLESLASSVEGGMGNKDIISIMMALQMQDRIEQRCQNISTMVSNIADTNIGTFESLSERLFSKVTLGEMAEGNNDNGYPAPVIDEDECELF